MVRVIINADDLGISHNVNEAIADGFKKGVLTSSTILANNTTWEEVNEIVTSNPNASFGVHLNLTEGPALSKSPILLKYNIVDDKGLFSKKTIERKVWTQELLEAVFEEWDLQVRMVKENHKIPITHFDGHHHIHTLYFLRNILMQLCNKHNIFKVRNTYQLPKHGMKKKFHTCVNIISKWNAFSDFICKKSSRNHLIISLKRLIENYAWINNTKSLSKPTYFASYETAHNLLSFSDNTGADVWELMCHPGHNKYIKETSLLMKNTIDTYALISYKDI